MRERVWILLAVALLGSTTVLADPPRVLPPPVREMPAPQARVAAEPLDVYVAPWCGYCRALEGDLRGRGIPFFRHDIEADARAKRAYDALGGQGLPLTKVGAEVVTGYDMPAILRLLARTR